MTKKLHSSTKMKILLAPLLLAVSLPAFAEVDPKIHKLCIEAKDYAGCVLIQEGKANEKKSLKTSGICAKQDMSGCGSVFVQVSEGSSLFENPINSNQELTINNSVDANRFFEKDETEVQNGFTYRNSSVRQLKIRGSYGRYLSFWGRSKNEYQGTSGSYNPGSAGSVNCTSTSYGYGSTSTNCSRSGYVAPSYTPGTSGGIQARWFEYELDCRDRTYNRKGDKAKGLINKGWMDVYYDPTARAVADKYCPIINSLRKKV
ncbi:hypothetical protein [Synechococcus sp. ROS8604]|uniref:hypothetical protein n=1 Tax=Synechococcus sp. ROS8604 TaxID=1442557 RepID=UPI001646DFA3|nr:hypothetical protein [Synechococcus sp. ROS8604]